MGRYMTIVLKAEHKNDATISAINKTLSDRYQAKDAIIFNTWAHLQEEAAFLNKHPEGIRQIPHFQRPITKEMLNDIFFWFRVGEYSCKISCTDSRQAQNAIAVCSWLADTDYGYIDQCQSENYAREILHQYLDPVLADEGIDPTKIWTSQKLGSADRKFPPERLYRLRRLRRARYLWKRQPLFAFAMMREQYPNYSHDDFCDDLRLRSQKRSKRTIRSPLVRYGRYSAFEALVADFHRTGNLESIRAAMDLRKRMTKPYRLLVRIEGEAFEYTLSPYIALQRIEDLSVKVRGCKNFQEVERMVDAVRATIKNGY